MEELETNSSMKRVPKAQVKPKVRFSLIWIIPLTAALIGGWLLFKYYTERGTMIDITFDEAAGIVEKKTQIRFKNVIVGKVQELSLNTDLNKVKVTAEIYSPMAENLGSDTRFWVVKPRISLQGVSGLDTLLSGVHIGIDPGTKSELLETYNGLPSPPFIASSKKGTRIALRTRSLGSLDVGSPIYYNKIDVGEVTSYRLNPVTGRIDVFIYVNEPYDSIIKSNTRFWNASGVEVDIGASGVSVRMEALTSLLIGGIAFETPRSRMSKEMDGERAFRLFDSYKVAQDNTQRDNKLFYEMEFVDSLHGLNRDSAIEFSGVKVGKVERIRLVKTDDSSRLKAKVRVSLNIDKFSHDENSEEAEKLLRGLVADGLVAQLTVDSLITGAQYIALNIPANGERLTNDSSDNVGSNGKPKFQLLTSTQDYTPKFPTALAQVGLLNFDATEISQELNKTLDSVTDLVSSNDIKKILSGLASTTDSLSRISKQLDKEGFSGELVATLSSANKATKDISRLILDSRSTMGKIGNATDQIAKDASHGIQSLSNVANKLQGDASQSMATFNNVANKLQRDVAISLNSLNKTSATMDQSINATLGEDSGLQYRLQLLINDLSEASKSFSVLADTLQRKPNSVIFGK